MEAFQDYLQFYNRELYNFLKLYDLFGYFAYKDTKVFELSINQ